MSSENNYIVNSSTKKNCNKRCGSNGIDPIGVGFTIPFASGGSIILTESPGATSSDVATINFGVSSEPLLPLPDGTIDLSASTTASFSLPRSGILSTISAVLSIVNTSITTPTTASVQIWRASATSNIFAPIPNAVAPFTTINNNLSSGTVLHVLQPGLGISLNPEDRLLIVFQFMAPTPIFTSSVIEGFVSGGINII